MFEIKYNTKSGHLFHVIIPREVNTQEAHDLAQLALNITTQTTNDDEPVFGPQQTPLADHINEESGSSVATQNKLGEHPVEYINLLSYKEPATGVRIKMLHFPEARMKALKLFREITGIGIIGCRDIVYGNFQCPVLSLEMAEKIMSEFKKLDVYAKIVPCGTGENRGRAA
jgi:hypothetical protein